MEPLDAQTGRPAHPIGVMVGCWMLKRLDYRSVETLMERWIENPTMPYFTGSDVMKHGPPCDPSDGRPMRDRMGQAGVEKIFAYSVHLNQKEIKKSSSMVLSETTVQGNHGTFPTDAKASKERAHPTLNGKHPRRAQKGHLQAQDLSGPTSPRARAKTSSPTKRSIPKRTRSVSTSDPSTMIRSKQSRCHSRLAWPKARLIK